MLTLSTQKKRVPQPDDEEHAEALRTYDLFGFGGEKLTAAEREQLDAVRAERCRSGE